MSGFKIVSEEPDEAATLVVLEAVVVVVVVDAGLSGNSEKEHKNPKNILNFRLSLIQIHYLFLTLGCLP